ncbi:MAG: PAS domain S-box-containing protein [Pseudoalteromonas tetraodonis]|jgi:PAS domain S-box-containing protein
MSIFPSYLIKRKSGITSCFILPKYCKFLSKPCNPSPPRPPFSPTQMPTSHSLQSDFYNRLGSWQNLGALYDALPSVLYFVKDRDRRFISGNQASCELLCGGSLDRMIGETDASFFPPELADQFMLCDEQVLTSGEPLIAHPEMICDRDGHPEWFVTNKQPLFDLSGEIIGLAGLCQPLTEHPRHAISNAGLRELVTYLGEHQDRVVSVRKMCGIARMSERQLYRQFDAAFHTTPVRFALSARLHGARRALVSTDQPVSEIALRFGFCDQSALTNQFKFAFGETPSSYRRRSGDRRGNATPRRGE